MGSVTEHQELTILHFNDVYHISDANLVARFATVLADPSLVTGDESYISQGGPTLRVFSGDAFSPSLEAAVLRGDHMAPVLDGLGVDVACYGNHDFDFGEARLLELAKQTSFPWTLANAVAGGDGSVAERLLAGAHPYVVKDVAGYRIGFFGLAGTDWPSNCQRLPECTILDPSIVARRVASHLRLSERCDLVIAVTHMRLVEDLAVSGATLLGDGRVDLVLGGHDHHVVRRNINDTNSNPEVLQSGFRDTGGEVSDYKGHVQIVKSGTDWRGLSVVRLRLGRGINGETIISNMSLKQISDLERLPNYNQIIPSPKMLKILRTIHNKIEKEVAHPLLRTAVPLDGRTRIIRSQETNLGNMLADAVRCFYDTDIALVNSGAIRCDRIIECVDGSPLCMRDLIEISPFDNAFVEKRVSGRVLAEALENSVSDAHTDGRFLQLSGLRITVNWGLSEGSRVSSIYFDPSQGSRTQLESQRMYTVAMVDFIGSGFDGYSCFQGAETLVDAEGGITDTNMLLQIFESGGSGEQKGGIADDHDHSDGVKRARAAIICGYHDTDGLPTISPVLDGRINVINWSNL